MSAAPFEPSRHAALGMVGMAGIAGLAQGAGAAAPGCQTRGVAFSDWPDAAAGGIGNGAALKEMVYPLPTSSMMILRGGKVAWSYGDVGEASYLASSRKSILSMLYGNAVARGQIKLDATIGELGIDDDGGLLPIEKTARVRDLLTARSGVYHPGGSPGGVENGPARGSHQPGTFFLYNNWDFNVAGAIYEKLTGKTIFKAFAEELAAPLGMQDFDPTRQHMLGYTPRRSRYLAYHFFLSCRDMAKLGQLMLDHGRWNGRQLVPAAWVAESTRLHVPSSETHMGAGDRLGYGYFWWILSEARPSPAFAGAYAALGHYGQYIAVLPALDMVMVHRRAVTDDFAIARNLGETNADPVGGEAPLLPLLDKIVDGIKI